jgi:hypothetical protein
MKNVLLPGMQSLLAGTTSMNILLHHGGGFVTG